MKKLDLLPPNQLVELTHAIHELNATINKSRVISLILANAARLSGCEGTCLVLFHKPGGAPPEVYLNGLSDAFAKQASTYSTREFRHNVAQKGSICFNHIPSDCKEGIRSIFCCSLTPDGKQIGLLYFLDYTNSVFPEDRTPLLQHFASYSAMAIRNSLIIEKKETTIQQLNTINQTTFSLSTASNTPSVIQDIVDQATSLIPSQTACLVMLHPGSDRIEKNYQAGDRSNGSLILDAHLEERFYETLKRHKVVNLTSRDLKSAKFSLPFSHPNLKNLLAFPLVLQKRLMGALILMNKTSASAYDNHDEQMLRTYGMQAVFSIENARLHERTETLAITDGLTELYNHREFQSRLQAEIRRSIRYKHPFTLLMIDIDHFKKINVTHGYEEGDKVLKDVSRIIGDSIRDIDIGARYGGEEFMVILPETPCERSLIVAERIRKKIVEKSFSNVQNGEEFEVTVSVGISCFPDDSLNREELITKCDQALYFAKRDGRNCVRRYDKTLMALIDKKEGKIAELLKDAKLKIMEELAAAVDAKNIYTRGHTDKVVHYAMHLAKILQLDPDQTERLKIASLLHDIGTVSIPDNVLNKTGPLSKKERAIIQKHPQLGEMMIRRSTPLAHVAPAVLHHHERYDGKGYPKGLSGEEIPLLARILCVAEAYQSMTSERSYRRKLSNGDAIQELKNNAGSQFDPGIVTAFVKTMSPSSPTV